jgi:2-polyprenyl-3-methyl-5-hydroxy-6-metoxy-1,4-benzoquinol methylase
MMDIVSKTREDYNCIAPLYARTRNSARELEQFAPFIKKGQKILDWGCGNGRLVYMLKDKGVEYYGIDQSFEMIRVAEKQCASEVAQGWVHFFCTENGEKNFPEKFFDRIFAVASFHHLPDKQHRLSVLTTFYHQLADDGILIMTNWNLESDWAQQKAKADWKKVAENDYFIPWKSGAGEVLVERYYHHFKPDELRDLFSEVGFKINELYYAPGLERADEKHGKNVVVIAQK